MRFWNFICDLLRISKCVYRRRRENKVKAQKCRFSSRKIKVVSSSTPFRFSNNYPLPPFHQTSQPSTITYSKISGDIFSGNYISKNGNTIFIFLTHISLFNIWYILKDYKYYLCRFGFFARLCTWLWSTFRPLFLKQNNLFKREVFYQINITILLQRLHSTSFCEME